MPYTMEDFQKDYVREHIDVLSAEEILKRFSADDRLKGLSAEEILKRFSADERLKGVSADDGLKGVSADERLKGVSLEELQQYLEKMKNESKE